MIRYLYSSKFNGSSCFRINEGSIKINTFDWSILRKYTKGGYQK